MFDRLLNTPPGGRVVQKVLRLLSFESFEKKTTKKPQTNKKRDAL